MEIMIIKKGDTITIDGDYVIASKFLYFIGSPNFNEVNRDSRIRISSDGFYILNKIKTKVKKDIVNLFISEDFNGILQKKF